MHINNFHFKNILRQKFNIVIFVAINMYLIYFATIFCLVDKTHVDVFRGITFGIMALYLFYLFIGHYIYSEDNNGEMDDVIISIGNNAYTKNFFNKIKSGLIIISASSIFTLIYLYILLYINKAAFLLYIDAFKYIFIYFFMASMVFFFLGIIISKFIKSRLSYGILIITFLLLTNLNSYLFKPLNRLGILNSLDISWYMTVGTYEPSFLYFDSFTGFQSQSFDFFKILLYLCITILILYMTVYKYKKYNLNIILVLLILISISTFNLYFNRKEISDLANIDVSNVQEKVLKNKVRYNKFADNSFSNYEITSYDINIDKNKMFTVNIKLNSYEKTNKFSFIFLDEFKIEKILDSNMNSLDFTKENNILDIKLPSSMEANNDISFTISYSGNVPYNFILDKNNMYLSSEIPFIPINKEKNLNKKTFSINIDGYDNVFSNIEKVSDNSFSGSSNEIVLFSSNRYEAIIYDDINFISPKIYPNIDFHEHSSSIKNVINKYNRIFDLDIQIPNKILLLNNKYYDYSHNIMFLDDTLIIKDWGTNYYFSTELFDFYMITMLKENLELNENLSWMDLMFYDIYKAFIEETVDFLESYLNAYKDIKLEDNRLELQHNISTELLRILEENKTDKNQFIKDFYNILTIDLNYESLIEFLKRY